MCWYDCGSSIVTLFTEGVDWNRRIIIRIFDIISHPLHRGCGLKFECLIGNGDSLITSPSSQRVWIEITFRLNNCIIAYVTLFTEGVDWNTNWNGTPKTSWSHPLHRGCGLKFYGDVIITMRDYVTLFTEGVDWNMADGGFLAHGQAGHPLHRGCGLKLTRCACSDTLWHSHPLHRGCGLK